ncbi:hypothetical protein J4Q44_G00068080, partial [Coregonus suidteri]
CIVRLQQDGTNYWFRPSVVTRAPLATHRENFTAKKRIIFPLLSCLSAYLQRKYTEEDKGHLKGCLVPPCDKQQ